VLLAMAWVVGAGIYQPVPDWNLFNNFLAGLRHPQINFLKLDHQRACLRSWPLPLGRLGFPVSSIFMAGLRHPKKLFGAAKIDGRRLGHGFVGDHPTAC